MPIALIVAIFVLTLLHVPGVLLVSVVVLPAHTLLVPDIGVTSVESKKVALTASKRLPPTVGVKFILYVPGVVI